MLRAQETGVFSANGKFKGLRNIILPPDLIALCGANFTPVSNIVQKYFNFATVVHYGSEGWYVENLRKHIGTLRRHSTSEATDVDQTIGQPHALLVCPAESNVSVLPRTGFMIAGVRTYQQKVKIIVPDDIPEEEDPLILFRHPKIRALQRVDDSTLVLHLSSPGLASTNQASDDVGQLPNYNPINAAVDDGSADIHMDAVAMAPAGLGASGARCRPSFDGKSLPESKYGCLDIGKGHPCSPGNSRQHLEDTLPSTLSSAKSSAVAPSGALISPSVLHAVGKRGHPRLAQLGGLDSEQGTKAVLQDQVGAVSGHEGTLVATSSKLQSGEDEEQTTALYAFGGVVPEASRKSYITEDFADRLGINKSDKLSAASVPHKTMTPIVSSEALAVASTRVVQADHFTVAS